MISNDVICAKFGMIQYVVNVIQCNKIEKHSMIFQNDQTTFESIQYDVK